MSLAVHSQVSPGVLICYSHGLTMGLIQNRRGELLGSMAIVSILSNSLTWIGLPVLVYSFSIKVKYEKFISHVLQSDKKLLFLCVIIIKSTVCSAFIRSTSTFHILKPDEEPKMKEVT